jgi:hypothetical protein
MKYPINLFALAAIFFFTSCQKEIIEEFEKNQHLIQHDYSESLNPETMCLTISDPELQDRAIADADEFELDRVRGNQDCPYNDCGNFLEEYGARLQLLANSNCETQYGAIVCCSMGEPTYMTLAVRPETRECPISNDPREVNQAEELSAGNTLYYQVAIKKDYCFLSGAMLSIINTVDQRTDFFESKRFQIEWFFEGRKIAEGTQINECICGDEITVIVNDLVNKTSIKKTTDLPECEITD